MLFWIIAIVLAAVSVVPLLAPLLRQGSVENDSESADIAIYRDQMAEVDRDLVRGVLSEDEADRTRTEIAHRLLSADKSRRHAAGQAPRSASIGLAAVTVALIGGGGIGGYVWLGAPGYPDLPLNARLAFSEEMRDSRVSQAEAEATVAAMRLEATGSAEPALPADLPAEYLATVAELREIVPQRPDDLRGWELLALHEARLGRFAEAARAQERVIALKGAAVTTDDITGLIDRLVAAADGFVSPEVDGLVSHLLDLDPANVAARYYTGLLYAQTDRPDIAFNVWREIVEGGGPGDVHAGLARSQIEETAFRAGIDYELPLVRGPSAADIAAAEDMSEEDRALMIRGMVEGLADRLATEGGTAQDWARLIGALGVLGEVDRASAIWSEARVVFAADEGAVAMLRDTALGAGVDVADE